MTASIARLIDHSLLHPTLTDAELRAGCELARRYEVASVCIKPYAVPLAVELLRGSPVKVGTVVGFPHGSSSTATKVAEADDACQAGAVELDAVVNVGKVLSGDWDYVEREIRALVEVAHRHGAILKVIFENDFLPSDEPKLRLCRICEAAGVDFVKTSTGFGYTKLPDGNYNYRGATEHDVRLMRAATTAAVEVKAAGGIRTYDEAARLRALGVTRLGATATEAIMAGEAAAAAPPRG
ncbi:MAG: deoxyribose-phosphate aldolase [Planctomycetaceae bacterium]|nr:deoxyribose-phosphate aldolase [Planctomycetaceae bacterium]